MTRQFISQPQDAFRLGNFLLEGFANHGWTEFRGASAFVKRSGTKHIKGAMKAFAARGGVVRFTAGVDAGGTSEQGLRDLIDAVGNGPGIFVYGNGIASTFHPKIYLFRNQVSAHLVVGSGNLTEGGLYTNYEANVLLKLDLSVQADQTLLETVTTSLDAWSTPTEGECFSLDAALLDRLMRDKVIPLLAEYFFEDWAKIAAVLGDLEPGESSITGGFLKRTILNPPPGLEDGDAVARFRWQVRSVDEGFDYSKLVGP